MISDSRPVRLRAGFLLSFLLLATVCDLAVVALLIGFGAVDSRPAPLITGLVLIPIVALLCWMTVSAWRFTVVDAGVIKVPGLVHGRVIDQSSVCGVGLVYVLAGRASGWRTLVWTVDGSHVSIVRQRIPRKTPIEKTRAARDTVAVWQRIVDEQGPTGPLRSVARQHDEASPWSMITKVWCPDDGTAYEPRKPQLAGSSAKPRPSRP